MNTRIERIETRYGQLYTLEGDVISLQLKQFAAHTRNELAMVLSFIRQHDVILDIGAHIGTFAIPIEKHLKDDVTIYAFEPQDQVAGVLKKNVQLHELSGKIKICHGLVSDKREDFIRVCKENNSGITRYIPASSNMPGNRQPVTDTRIYIIDEMVQQGIPGRCEFY